MFSQVKENLEMLGVKPNDRLLVAVSGGADSVLLLHLLFQLSKIYPFELHVAHLNHALRGEESDEDARFVGRIADSLNLSSTIVKKEIALIAKSQKRSKQEAARTVRYQLLEEVSIRNHCQWIVTGHHADDQAETFLLRLIRGAGTLGLTSIPMKRGKILRPLLHISRAEILNYLEENKIDFREDRSNDSPVYFRNQIRHELLPLLKRYNPNIVKVLGNEIDILEKEKQFLEERIRSEIPEMIRFSDSNKRILKVGPFIRLPLAMQRGCLRALFFQLKGSLVNLQFNHIEQVIRLVKEGKPGSRIDLPEGVRIYKDYEEFEISTPGLSDMTIRFDGPLPVPGEMADPERHLLFRTQLKYGPVSESPKTNEIWFDYDRILPPLKLRRRQPGDFIYPERLKGKKKKLQDLFVDLKISRRVRDRIPLLSGADRILWVVGIERDYQSRVTPGTKTILSIETSDLP